MLIQDVPDFSQQTARISFTDKGKKKCTKFSNKCSVTKLCTNIEIPQFIDVKLVSEHKNILK